MQEALKLEPLMKELANKYLDAPIYAFIGSDPNWVTALLAAAKMKETSQSRSKATNLEEYAHLHGITFGIYWVSAVSYANDLAPENLKATAQGMLVATLNLAAVLGGVVSGLLYDHFGLAFLFRLYSGLTIVALVLLGVRRRV